MKRVCYAIRPPGRPLAMAGFVFARSLASAQRIARQYPQAKGMVVERDEEWDHYLGLYMHNRRKDVAEARGRTRRSTP